jgi:ABC-type glycerol-3-phosphate transport system permease component
MKNVIKTSSQDRVFHIFNAVFLLLCSIFILVPTINVISSSISNPSDVLNGKVTFLPVNISLKSYTYIFKEKMIMSGYMNSIYYTVAGTIVAVVMTVLAAYPLSRKELRGKKIFIGLFMFTMIFSGGLIPTYIVVKNLHMIDKIWAVIIPNCLSVYNLIIARTFFTSSIPVELYEAAEIDGANDYDVFFKIVLPLSKAITAVLALFYAIGLWNMYFDAVLYLNTNDHYPLQVILRNIMNNAQVQADMVEATGKMADADALAITESLKYTTIVCATVPMLLLYPFIQKYFTKGVMIGSVKG